MKNLPDKDELVSLLQASVKRFNDSIDRTTLLTAPDHRLEVNVSAFRVAHEQAISHRLAFYLECSLRKNENISDQGPLVVDCEYNQHLFNSKRIWMHVNDAKSFLAAGRKAYADAAREDVLAFEFRPDILLHQRGCDGPTNLLVIEVKRWTNPDKAQDEQKLKLLTKLGLNSFGYVLGAAVYARNDLDPPQRVLELGGKFHDGDQF